MDEFFYFTEASMEDSFIYKTFNNANSMMAKMVEYIKLSEVLGVENIEDQYRQIKRSSVSPLSRFVLEAFDKGLIEIRYSPDPNVRVASSIPFVIRRNGDKVIATIFIKAFTSVVDGVCSIPTKNLYTIMEAAYIALCIHQYPVKLDRNTTLAKLLMEIYTQMCMKILIKEYALTMDRPLCDKVRYCIARFFLEKVWGLKSAEIVNSYASSIIEYITTGTLTELGYEYGDANIGSVNDLIVFIQKMAPRLKDLKTKYFIEKWISNYHAPAILAIDYLPYLIFTVNSVLLGSFLVSQNALADIVKNTKGMTHYYSELTKTFSTMG